MTNTKLFFFFIKCFCVVSIVSKARDFLMHMTTTEGVAIYMQIHNIIFMFVITSQVKEVIFSTEHLKLVKIIIA